MKLDSELTTFHAPGTQARSAVASKDSLPLKSCSKSEDSEFQQVFPKSLEHNFKVFTRTSYEVSKITF